MGLIAERGDAADGYEAVPILPASDETAEAADSGRPMLRRPSALPSRRAVLCVHGQRDTFVPEDLPGWYTERGFHFYVADLRPPDGQRRSQRQRRRARAESAQLDAACRHLRQAEGIEMIIMTADGADAATAAVWCDARTEADRADALILTAPVFGRRLRRGLDIACPVLVLGQAGGEASRRGPGRRRGPDQGAVKLGAHVTWLRLDDGPTELDSDGDSGAVSGADSSADSSAVSGANADRRRFFDEMGRWLGAYMYGQVRDQLL
jgi:alpha-beta hydrolase superfamily lysophospholipase